jgi:hypothetical protein
MSIQFCKVIHRSISNDKNSRQHIKQLTLIARVCGLPLLARWVLLPDSPEDLVLRPSALQQRWMSIQSCKVSINNDENTQTQQTAYIEDPKRLRLALARTMGLATGLA